MSSLLSKIPQPPPERTGWPWTEETPPAIYSDREDWPRICIVTPSFNQAEFIEETIRSILLQNYPNLQYVVIDGGSTDGTVQILERYSQWIDYWESEPDRGQSHAINKGLARCAGEWFNWINSDDLLLPCALALLAQVAKSRTVTVIAGYLLFGKSASTPTKRLRIKCTSDLEDTIVNHGMRQPSTFYSLQWVRNSGGLCDVLHYAMDLELWIRTLSEKGTCTVVLTDYDFAFFREHSEAKTTKGYHIFEEEERAIYRVLGTLVGLSNKTLDYISPRESELKMWPVSALNKRYMADLLIKCYVWGSVEKAWQRREFNEMRRGLAFYSALNRKSHGRFYFLKIMSCIPNPILEILGGLWRIKEEL